jgi:hypothetical protein
LLNLARKIALALTSDLSDGLFPLQHGTNLTFQEKATPGDRSKLANGQICRGNCSEKQFQRATQMRGCL